MTEVEQRLKLRRKVLERAERAYREALLACGLRPPRMSPDGGRRQQNAVGRPTEQAAMRLRRAEERLARARAWVKLAEDVQLRISPDARAVFGALFTEGDSAAHAARVTGLPRRRVYELRQETLIVAAVLAEERGLVRISDAKRMERI